MIKYKTLKFIFIIFVCFLLQITSAAQNINAIKADRHTYIWGEGSGATLKEADQIALADIIGQISTQVESSFEKTVLESGKNFKETVNDVLKTYSSATLKNTERIILQNEPDAKVFRYVKRSEVAKVFESRKNKLIQLARDGETALKNLQIADALRYFYWSQTFLRSHPDASDIKMTTSDGSEVLVITWLPKQINEIFANLAVEIDGVEKKDSYSNFILDIRYKNEPVRNLDYIYWGGQDWSNIISAKDGLGIIEMANSQKVSEIRIKAEYVFENEANVDLELRDVMQRLPDVSYRNCFININLNTINAETTKKTNSDEKSNFSITKSSESESEKLVSNISVLTNVEDKNTILSEVISAINSNNYKNIESYFTPEAYLIFQSLLQYGNVKILKYSPLKYFQFGDQVIARSIPMSFNFKTNNRMFIEDVVFYFDKNNKISNLTFGLGEKAVDDIASNEKWSETVRMQLINFMENYKTAYALKRIDYIEKIFSDDALIIVGRITKINSSPENRYLNNSILKYNKVSKAQYLKNLKYSFASNEFINLKLTDNTVKQSGKSSNVYGIQIKQDYFSSSYGDTGYLFLLIDFTDSLAPQIHVRTWQPEKNPDGSVYGLSDF
jgi:hypothetical protein